jgi:hypothetical protein
MRHGWGLTSLTIVAYKASIRVEQAFLFLLFQLLVTNFLANFAIWQLAPFRLIFSVDLRSCPSHEAGHLAWDFYGIHPCGDSNRKES